jgi:acetyl esterase
VCACWPATAATARRLPAPGLSRRRPAPLTSNSAPQRAAVVTAEHLHWFSDQYLAGDQDRLNPLASPILAELTTLPPAHLVLAHADPQCAAGEHFSRQLRAAGVPATARCCPGMFHGFYNVADQLGTPQRPNTDVHTILREALNNPNSLSRMSSH